MGLFDRFKGRKSSTAERPGDDDDGFERAAELAGFFVAHAVWCVSDGETLVPLLGHEGPSGRQMIRLASERLEEGVSQGQARMESNPDRASRAVLIYDGFFTFEGARKDALISKIVAYGGPTRRSLEIVVPYRPASAGGGFAVHKPKFMAPVGLPEDITALGEAFFRGVDSHEKGTKVWADSLDETF